jgi:DNA ligase (NAD+)
MASIRRSMERPLERLYFALGIRHVGEHLARVLAEEFPRIHDLMGATEEELTTIRDVGPKVARAVADFFRQPRNAAMMESLLQLGVRPTPPRPVATSPLAGKTVVFTGTLEAMTRQEAQALVARWGGRVASGVTARTDLVVAGPGAGSKLERAQELGVPVLTEADFLALAPEGPP